MVRYIFYHPLSAPTRKKKKRLSFRLPRSGAPLGAPLDGKKKKGGCERVRQRKNHCRQQRMQIANQYSLRYDWVPFISELRFRCRHIVEMGDMLHTWSTEPTSVMLHLTSNKKGRWKKNAEGLKRSNLPIECAAWHKDLMFDALFVGGLLAHLCGSAHSMSTPLHALGFSPFLLRCCKDYTCTLHHWKLYEGLPFGLSLERLIGNS